MIFKILKRKFEVSRKMLKNKRKNIVLFEKYNPNPIVANHVFFAVQNNVNQNCGIMVTQDRVVLNKTQDTKGGYDVTGGNKQLLLMSNKRPTRFNRFAIAFFLGWKWIEREEL